MCQHVATDLLNKFVLVCTVLALLLQIKTQQKQNLEFRDVIFDTSMGWFSTNDNGLLGKHSKD